jgi:transcriptional regulator with AAA-type ATPase domain
VVAANWHAICFPPPVMSFVASPPIPGSLFRLPDEGLVFEELERELVRQALERTGGNQTHAARLLGMTRDQIRYRLRKFELSRSARSPRG